jgi:hypothetical protein
MSGQYWIVLFAGLAGCAAQQAENHALGQFPGIEAQIQGFYDDNATEDDWVCTEVDLDTIDKSQVVSENAEQMVIAVTYFFTSDDLSPGRGGNQCQGFNTRFFTFNKGPGGQLSLASMSGPQRGQQG